jgi:glycogen synthase
VSDDFHHLMARAMRQDFSWRRSAHSYLDLYRRARSHFKTARLKVGSNRSVADRAT